MTMQRTTGGNLLRTTASGLMAKECCCGGVTPSSCVGGDPELYLTLFDADYAGGNITWAGETWTQAEVQSGTEKGPVCPTSYANGFYGSTLASGTATAVHNWAYNSGGQTQLKLRRGQVAVISYVATRNPQRYYYLLTGAWSNSIYGKGGYPDIAIKAFYGPLSFKPRPLTINFSTTVGALTSLFPTVNIAAPRPVPHGTYQLPASFTQNSYTSGGIQYSWRRGNGW